MKNVITIFKKDFFRVIKDKRLVLSVLILPGLMIYLIYSMMGGAINKIGTEIETHTPNMNIVYLSSELNGFIDILDLELNINSLNSDFNLEDQELLLRDNTIDLLVVFDQDFDKKINENIKPSFTVYYNPSEMNSYNAYMIFLNIIEQYEKKIILDRVGDISVIDYKEPILVFDEKKAQGKEFASLLPFLIITFLFSGAMAIGPESISGEKERGTIATILITPIKRTELALGKILSLSVLAIISALSSFVGIMLSLPKLLGNGTTLDDLYNFKDYVLILLVLFSTVLVIVGAISIISAFAKSVKEAGLYIIPLYIVSMLIGLLSMFQSIVPSSKFIYLIPIYNSILSLSSVFLFSITKVNILITIVSNVVYAGILALILAKMFKSEKIMFGK